MNNPNEQTAARATSTTPSHSVVAEVVAEITPALVQQEAARLDAQVGDRAFATGHDGGTVLGPLHYRQLADTLLLNEQAWNQFMVRCKVIYEAGFYGHKSPATVAAAALKGMSMGMSFMESLARIKVIHGTPVIRGPAAINHIHERSPSSQCRCITGLVGSDAEVNIDGFDLARVSERLRARYPDCWTADELGLDATAISVWVMARPGWATKVFIYTWAQAMRAGLPAKNDSYNKFPERCLKWQAASEGAQEMFGDVLDGLYFEIEIASTGGAGRQTASRNAGAAYTPKPTPPPEPEEHVEHTEDHPKVAEFKDLLHRAVQAQFPSSDDEYKAVRASITKRTVFKALGKDLNGKSPTLPQFDKLIACLAAQLEEDEKVAAAEAASMAEKAAAAAEVPASQPGDQPSGEEG